MKTAIASLVAAFAAGGTFTFLLAADEPKAKPPTPPVARYELKLGEQRVTIEEDKPFELTVNGAPLRGTLVGLPMQFDAAGISFEYSKRMAYEFKRHEDDVDTHTLLGDSVVVRLQVHHTPTDPAKEAKQLIEDLGPVFGDKDPKIEAGKMTLGGKQYDTVKARLNIGEVSLLVEAVGLKTTQGTVVLYTQSNGTDDGSPTEEMKTFLATLGRTIQIK